MKRTVLIGLTGQTGAGKSTLCAWAEEYHCKIINADTVAREVMQNNADCLKRLAEFFGSDIIKEDGSCNRKLLAQRAFSSRENTDMLNRITHPPIIARTREYIAMYQGNIIIFDAPQLFESGGDKLCDKIIAVVAPEKVRLERIIQRDGISEQEALLRMNVQYDEEFYRRKADYIIDGSQPLDKMKEQFTNILKQLAISN